MSDQVKVYNADELLITMGPVVIESGLGDGEFLSIEDETESAMDVAGTDGEVAVSRSNDQRANVTITLLATSAANDGLSVLLNLFKTAPGSAGGIVPFAVADLNGRTIMSGANAWVKKAPDRKWQREVQMNAWEIRVAHLKRFDGGN
jgi:hypothetical protein